MRLHNSVFGQQVFSRNISPRAEDHILMTMADWSSLLQKYMDLNNRPMLPDAGRVTHEQAVEKALTEYDKYRVIQDREIMSDFDRQLKLLFGDNE